QPEQLDRALRELEKAKRPGKLKGPPDGPARKERDVSVTDLNPPLERGLKPAGQGEGKLVGIVLLTDGRHNAATAPDKTAEELGKRAVPVYPVVVGTPHARSSVTLAEVQAPSTASSKNVEVTVRARFKVAGMRPQNIVLSLERADRRPAQPKSPDPIAIAHD